MNNDATPTLPADPHPNQTRRHHRQPEDNADGTSDTSSSDSQQRNGSPTPNRSQGRPSLSKKAKEGLSKKLTFLLHLLLSLDTLICAELCTLYYMDCSFFRLMIRWAPQWLYLSPKPENLVLIIPNYPVGAILAVNVFCIMLHLIASLPHAGEASRGYLHGGVLIDFVGQKPPGSKLTLILLDMLVLGLQCFMLAVSIEKDRIKKIIKPPNGQADVEGNGTTSTGQDHDAEERGVLRDAPTLDETDDIEMQSIGTNREIIEEWTTGDRSTVLPRRSSMPSDNYEKLGDVLSSGNAILADFHVKHALRTAWNDTGSSTEGAAAYAVQNLGYNATFAAIAAHRRARLAGAQTQPPG